MKRLLKYALIPALASRPVSALATWFMGQGIPVFMLHRMDTGNSTHTGHSPDHLRRCLEYLKANRFAFISLEDAILSLKYKHLLPDKSVVFTIDDGFWDQAEIAAPIFLEFDTPATFFVITGMLDNDLWPWDAVVSHLISTSQRGSLRIKLAQMTFDLPLTNNHERHEARQIIRDTIKALDNESMDEILDELARATGISVPRLPPDHFRPMTWDTARQLEEKGIKFAPHSITHRMLSMLDADSSRHEITGSWQRVKNELASPSPVFCYPTGRPADYGAREIDTIKKAGLLGAVSTIPACVEPGNASEDYVYNLPRFSLPSTFEDFIQCCTWIERVKS